jgi:hypothetical protein
MKEATFKRKLAKARKDLEAARGSSATDKMIWVIRDLINAAEDAAYYDGAEWAAAGEAAATQLMQEMEAKSEWESERRAAGMPTYRKLSAFEVELKIHGAGF